MTGPSRKLAIASERMHAGNAPDEATRGAAAPAGTRERTEAGDARLAAVARAEYVARRRRDRLFDADIFAEPAWDMLLDLFIQRHEQRSVSVHSLCIAAAVPQTTALRWITKLACNGLLDRHPCTHDNRVIHITLSETGLAVMERYLESQLGESGAGSAPPLSFS